MPWVFLVVSFVGAAFTVNAFRPAARWQLLAPSFFAGWLTNELAPFHLVWQVLGTLLFVRWGALDAWAGWLGLAITMASWGGLLYLILVARRASTAMEDALVEGLGPDYREEIAPGMAERIARGLSWSKLVLPFYLRSRTVERVKDIRYAEGAQRRHLLDVYRPKGVTLDRAPVLFQIHGGAWIIGDKSQQGLPLMLRLASEGWVCVANNYRLSPRASFPDHLVDCKLALAWIREHIAEYGGDPDFVVVTGGSAGGHLAALVGLTANDPGFQPGFEDVDTSVVGCVPFYGLYDLAETFGRYPKSRRTSARVERMIMGTTLDEDRAAFDRASPISYVGPDAPPCFVIHGSADNLAEVAQARRFVDTLRAESRSPVLYAEIPGASHAFDVFHSVRADNVVNGVERFLAWLYSAYQAVDPSVPADPVGPNASSEVDAAAG